MACIRYPYPIAHPWLLIISGLCLCCFFFPLASSLVTWLWTQWISPRITMFYLVLVCVRDAFTLRGKGSSLYAILCLFLISKMVLSWSLSTHFQVGVLNNKTVLPLRPTGYHFFFPLLFELALEFFIAALILNSFNPHYLAADSHKHFCVWRIFVYFLFNLWSHNHNPLCVWQYLILLYYLLIVMHWPLTTLPFVFPWCSMCMCDGFNTGVMSPRCLWWLLSTWNCSIVGDGVYAQYFYLLYNINILG
jgi:hypothetical protein